MVKNSADFKAAGLTGTKPRMQENQQRNKDVKNIHLKHPYITYTYINIYFASLCCTLTFK